MRPRIAFVLCALLACGTCTGARAADSVDLSELEAVDDADLAQMRGGLMLANGVEIAISLTRGLELNGEFVVSASTTSILQNDLSHQVLRVLNVYDVKIAKFDALIDAAISAQLDEQLLRINH